MASDIDKNTRGTLRGVVFGDLVGSPYMIENTYDRYFELGESRRAYSRGRVRTFLPEATEVSHAAAAVSSWLSIYRDDPTVGNLRECLKKQYDRHPRGGWTEATRLFLTSGEHIPSKIPDWAALARAVPIASVIRDDYFRALEITEAAVMATCVDPETIHMARGITTAIHMALDGRDRAEIFTRMEMEYSLLLSRPDEDLRAELRGEIPEPVMMLGVPVPGAYRYVPPKEPGPIPVDVVTEAAVRSVLQSDSWEDAVRRAVAWGGPSNAVAGIAGGLAEAIYGEVSPRVVGKLYPYIPQDIVPKVEQQAPSRSPASGRGAEDAISRDALTIVSLGPGRTVYVVPEERHDVRKLIDKTFPSATVIPPSDLRSLLDHYEDRTEGTHVYGVRPEVRTLYVQDGEKIVSPSAYVAPGMPPLQQRELHLKEFLALRSFCADVQKELNEAAGNPGGAQIHYSDAYHLWIGSRQIDFMMGGSLAGRISLNERGLLSLDLGDYRDLSADARFEGHREQAWRVRGVFTIQDSVSPIDHLPEIRGRIRERLLDEGMGLGETDSDLRHLTEEEKAERRPVSNVDHLERLDGEELSVGMGPAAETFSQVRGELSPGKIQSVDSIYTIGYGIRTQEGFINTLRMAGVDTVVDVRSVTHSKFVPHFDEERIYEALTSKGMYYYVGSERLGGRPEGAEFRDGAGRVDWERVRESDAYREGIESVVSLAGEGHSIAVVCSEGDPLTCHRFGMVSRDLEAAGLKVKHILPNGEIVSQAVLEDRMVSRYEKAGKLASSLGGSYRDEVREAYRLMNDEYGHKQKSNSRTRAFRIKF